MDNIKKCKTSSRKIMVYIVMFLWLAFGIFVSIYVPKDSSGADLPKVIFTDLAVYFVSLTGFVGAFIYGDTVNTKNWATPIFMKGKNDSRETIVYMCMLLWLVSGVYCIMHGVPLSEIGAYFAALTPFVGGFILGETKRSSNPLGIPAIVQPVSVAKTTKVVVPTDNIDNPEDDKEGGLI